MRLKWSGGFIGNHLVSRLKQEGFWVRGVDLKYPEFSQTEADDFAIGDLREGRTLCRSVVDRRFDEIYQLAADMGGAGYIFTGEHDAHIMHNSATINLNILDVATKRNCRRIFYSSSACMYPAHNQEDSQKPVTSEDSAYPANPDSEYGWEKLFSERLYLAYNRNLGIEARVARYHNIFGPLGTWQGGREKAPAAICRKVAEATDGGEIEIWGDGEQTLDLSFHRRMCGRHRFGFPLLNQLRRTGQYRIGGNGYHQSTCCVGYEYSGQKANGTAYSRTDRSTGPQFGQ